MILSAGLTPAWQQVLVFERFRLGEVNRASEVSWCAQGKVINAGIGVFHLGDPSLMLSPLGGPGSASIDSELAALGVPRQWIPTEAATRVCTTVLDRSTGNMTELVENAQPLTEAELDSYQQAYAAAVARAQLAIITGSLPTGTPETFYRKLVEQAACPVVLDFRGQGLLDVLALEPLAVKPNREELGHTVGRELQSDDELIRAMRSLNERGAQWVAITQGAGAVWLTSRREVYRVTPPHVPRVVNPIGCGDSMAAGMAHALLAGQPMVQAVRYGVAAAVDNLGQLLACRLDPSRVAGLMEHVVVERID